MIIDLSIVSIVVIIFVYVYWIYWFFLTGVYLFGKNITHATRQPQSHFVSIIIPASNEEKVISGVISDCLKQTHKDLEVILVAHNCKDNTAEKANQFKDSRVKVFPLTTEEWGKGIALNYGIEKCRGDVTFIFDSDASFAPNFVEKVLDRLDEGFDAVQAKIIGKNPTYNTLTFLEHIESLLFITIFCESKEKLKQNAIIGGTGACIKTEVLKKVGGFKNVLSEDLEMYIKLTKMGYRIGYTNEVYVNDEKPISISSFIRQRSRWQAGHMTIMRKQSIREDIRMIRYDPLNFIFLFTPVFLAMFWANLFFPLFAIILSVFSIDIIFVYGSVAFWIFSVVIMIIFYVLTLQRQKEYFTMKMVKLFPLFLLFLFYNLYGYISFWRAFTVSKSWEHTKTEHGFMVSKDLPQS